MSWTLSTSAAAVAKAGINANSTVTADATILAKWSDQAEAALSTITRKDWVADYADVTANFKGILDDVISDMVAMKIIIYDMGGYTSRLEAQTMLDVIRDNLARNLNVLQKEENKEVMD